jgi:hypothetical protein
MNERIPASNPGSTTTVGLLTALLSITAAIGALYGVVTLLTPAA